MKARIKKTGEIVNLASYAAITLDVCDSWGNPIEMKPEDIELIQDKTDDFDWQSFRVEAAKDILCAMIQSGYYGEDRIVHHSELAVKYTDELIKQLKKED